MTRVDRFGRNLNGPPAGRLGLELAEYEAMLAAGRKWCTGCQAWHTKSVFGRNRARNDGLQTHCRAWRRRSEPPPPQWSALDTAPADLIEIRSVLCKQMNGKKASDNMCSYCGRVFAGRPRVGSSHQPPRPGQLGWLETYADGRTRVVPDRTYRLPDTARHRAIVRCRNCERLRPCRGLGLCPSCYTVWVKDERPAEPRPLKPRGRPKKTTGAVDDDASPPIKWEEVKEEWLHLRGSCSIELAAPRLGVTMAYLTRLEARLRRAI